MSDDENKKSNGWSVATFVLIFLLLGVGIAGLVYTIMNKKKIQNGLLTKMGFEATTVNRDLGSQLKEAVEKQVVTGVQKLLNNKQITGALEETVKRTLVTTLKEPTLLAPLQKTISAEIKPFVEKLDRVEPMLKQLAALAPMAVLGSTR